MTAVKPPPEKMSELLQMARDDLVKFAATPTCRVDMYTWIEVCDSVCYACLAGATLIQEGIVERPTIYDHFEHSSLSNEWYGAVMALDSLRNGNIRSAYEHRRRSMPAQLPVCVNSIEYIPDPLPANMSLEQTPFFECLANLIDLLRKAGD
jgi:hypothetical protein